MIYSGDLIKINGKTLSFIVSYKVGRNKLWKDADRNMNGDVRATLIGIFPKIEITTRVLNQDEMSELVTLLDEAYFDVEYFDVRAKGSTTASYYASDYNVEMINKHKGLYSPLTVSLVPVSKRRY